MEPLKFKTDIKCSGCIAKVTPHLNDSVGSENWNVNIEDPGKILTITGETDEEKIREALNKAGFKAERLS